MRFEREFYFIHSTYGFVGVKKSNVLIFLNKFVPIDRGFSGYFGICGAHSAYTFILANALVLQL